jgi:hypothetical protein
LEYIPVKTSGHRAFPVRVPLTPTAVEIVARYAGETEEGLLPCKDVAVSILEIAKIGNSPKRERPQLFGNSE